MIRMKTGAVLLACIASAVHAQTPAAKPQFDVATVKPAAPQPMGMMRVGSSGGPGTKDPGRYTAMNMSLANLLMQAYDIKRFQLTGPAFLDSERFDVTAKVPEGATKEQFRLMLQGLLEERFKMAIHKEKKEGQVYELVQAKGGHKLKEYVEDPAAIAAAQAGGPGAALPPPPPPGSPGFQMGKDGFPAFPKGAPGRGPMMVMMNGRAKMQAEGITIEQLVNMLSNQVGKPVVDATNLKGKYDMTLFYSPEGLSGGPGGGRMMVAVGPPGGHVDGPGGAGGPAPAPADSEVGPTLFAALQEQLGLKLEQKKGTVDLIAVDKMEKAPTEN